MATLDSVDTPKTDIVAPEASTKKRNRQFKHGIQACKNYRRKLIRDWAVNVDYRRGKPFASNADEDRVVVNLDWSFTSQKQASLFSQVPAIRVSHPPQTIAPEMAPWLHNFEQRINDTLVQAGIETAMDEILPDCINAAGLGLVIVSHEILTEDREVPSPDIQAMPEFLQQHIMTTGTMFDGSPVPMETIPFPVDKRYTVKRVSPSDLLWPLTFNGSDFDDSPWIGRSGKVLWTEAQRRWKLDEGMKSKYLGIEDTTQDYISTDTEREVEEQNEEFVSFDEIFYKTQLYDATNKRFASIHHLVFVNGQEKPVIDEPWKGQEETENGDIIGALKYPIRILTLSYITDEAIPPSDSAVGRPQVNEIIKARTQMIMQREYSLPVRTADVNRVDPAVLYNLMQGKWQAFIPVQGNGQNVITEVARSAFPQENFSFDVIANRDLEKIWNVGQSSTGEEIETKGESMQIAQNSQTRVARERAKVGKFFCSIAEVIGGLVCLYEDSSTIGEGFDPQVSKTLSYSILADSTVLLDSKQRLQRIEEFVNMYAKSGWVNLEPVLREAATLSGLDPALVIKAPEPKPPVEPNISLRLTGTEDMLNPLTLGFLIKAGQAPDIEAIEQAKRLIEAAVTPPPMDMYGNPIMPPTQQANISTDANGNPAGPSGAGGQLTTPPPMPGGMPQPLTQADVGELPMPPVPEVGGANPNWSAMSKINQRVLDREGGK